MFRRGIIGYCKMTKKMKLIKWATLLLFLIPTGLLNGQQNVQSVVFDKTEETEIAYASIGFAGSRIGTLTDINGHFSLSIPKEYEASKLTISHVNYRSLDILASKLSEIDTIWLEPSNQTLPMVEVVSQTLGKTTVFGKNKNRTSATFRFASNKAGTELATKIETKGRQVLVKTLNFNIFKNDFSKAAFRVHLYPVSTESGSVGDDLIRTDKVVFFKEKTGILSVDLLDENILLLPKYTYLMSIEWLEEMEKNENDLIQFSAGIGLNQNIYFKYATFSKWKMHTKKYFGLSANLAFYLEGVEVE